MSDTTIAKCGHEVKVIDHGGEGLIVPDCCSMCEELIDAYGDEDEYLDRVSGCYECGGRGWKVVCIDDLCHGQDECIHGDPPVPCRNCNPKGLIEDSL